MAEALHVVLGASGGTGSAVTEALVAGGNRVRAVVHRSGGARFPAGVEPMAADVTDADDARRAVEGATTVYHCAQPDYLKWAAEFPAMTRTIAAAAADAGAKLVFADNLYTYDFSRGPITERTPETADGPRARLRKTMADELLSLHREGRLRVTIGRSSDFYGPSGIGSAVGERLFEGVLRGKKAQWLGSLDVPHTCSYLPDMGRSLATLGERPEADGRVWIVPAAPAITGRDFINMASDAAGTRPKMGAATPGMVRLAGIFVPFIRAMGETLPQWTSSFTVDASAFEAAFGPVACTPHTEAIPTTVAWFRQRAASTEVPGAVPTRKR